MLKMSATRKAIGAGIVGLLVGNWLGIVPDGAMFGTLDNGILILGAYTGLQLDDHIAKVFKGARPGLGAIVGAAIGNLVSDVAGCLVDPAMSPMVGGIALGCMLPMLIIPAIEWDLGGRHGKCQVVAD